jgi:hypothetical protein
MLSHKAVPGSKNPFLTPTGQLRGKRDSPPHLAPPFSHKQTRFPQMQLIPCSVGSSSSDEEQYPPHKSGPITRMTKFNEIYGQMGIDPNDNQDVIREKMMAGIPAWPTDLRLSLNANNWLEWSHKVLNNLKMAQLHMYPLGLLNCPDARLDRASNQNWRGNDQMVLGYMNSHIYLAESQYIADCTTSVEAYRTLQRRHKKHSGLTQTQLIQRMMQVCFDMSSSHCNTIMSNLHDIIYWID